MGPYSLSTGRLLLTAVAVPTLSFVTGVAAKAIVSKLQTRAEVNGSRVRYVRRRCPASLDDKLQDIDTPCLIIDLDKVDENLATMAKSMAPYPGVVIRPHAKAHKSSDLALYQLNALKGQSNGVCCQKVSEAEAMFAGGVQDILLSNVVVSQSKLERLALLAQKGCTVSICFDDPSTVRLASQIAASMDVKLFGLVEVNVGQNRCGVDTIEEAVELAKLIDASPGLTFKGIQAYHGAAQHIRKHSDRQSAIEDVCTKAQAVQDACLDSGLKCEVVTGGGTGTYLFEAASGIYNEVQPGSFVLNDADYAKNLADNGKETTAWAQSLFVLTTVISRNVEKGFVVVDAGMKAVSFDSGEPLIEGHPEMKFENAGDEHGKIYTHSQFDVPRIGELFKLIPGHCDPTVNMHDYIVGIRGGTVKEVWELSARGPGL